MVIYMFCFNAILKVHLFVQVGFPGGACGREPTCQYRRHKRCRFDLWVEKIPWRIAWQHTPVFLPGKSYGQRTLMGYSPQGHKESDTIEATWHSCTHAFCIEHSTPKEQNALFYPSTHRILSKIHHRHGHITDLSNFKTFEIKQFIF